LGGDGFDGNGGFPLGAVAGGVVEEHAAAVLAVHDDAGGFGFGAVVAEVVPALRTDHHPAGGALLVQGFGDGCAFSAGNTVVVGERGFAGFALNDIGAEVGAQALDFEQGGVVCGGGLDGAGAFALKGGGCFGNGGVGECELGFESFAALHGFELGVFDAADLGAGKDSFVLEGFELMGSGGHVELLLRALEFLLEVGDVGLFLAAESVFLGYEAENDGALAYSGRGLGFQRGDILRQRGHLVAQAPGFNVVRLEDDKLGKIRMHEGPPFFRGHRTACGALIAEKFESSMSGWDAEAERRVTRVIGGHTVFAVGLMTLRCTLQSRIYSYILATLSSVPKFLRDDIGLCATCTRGFSLAPARLLLVDDDDSVLSGLGVVLEAHEFDVTTASNVSEAVKYIAAEHFDVLLTDLHMPGAGDGLIVAGAMRHANPSAVTLILSANPDMAKATSAVLRQVDEIVTKPVKASAIVELIRRRLQEVGPPGEIPLTEEDPAPQPQAVELVATLINRERATIARIWLAKLREGGSQATSSLSVEEHTAHLQEMLNEMVYRLLYPRPLGLMTLFSMASLQHGARRRRRGFRSPVLVEEARALQMALFQVIQDNMGGLDQSQLPGTLMAIADEINGQLLQSLSGYENEKPGEFPADDR
jgi:DNA-binding response OmpR family regulator